MIRIFKSPLPTFLALIIVMTCSSTQAEDAASAESKPSQDALERVVQRGYNIRYMAICGDQKRRDENGPRDEADLKFVLDGVERGTPECEILLADWSTKGTGVPMDIEHAKALYLSAAESRPRAYIALGKIAEADSTKPTSLETAAAFYRRAADADIPEGQIELGRMYESGLGVERNLEYASELYRKAAIRKDDGWRNLDRIQSEHPHMSEEQIDVDRNHWRSILAYRIRDSLAESRDLAILNQKRSIKIKLVFERGAVSLSQK